MGPTHSVCVPPGPRESVLTFIDEGARGRVKEQTAIGFGIEGEVEIVEVRSGSRVPGFAEAFEQPISAARQFVRDQVNELQGSHALASRDLTADARLCLIS
jgi:hypothetical protein